MANDISGLGHPPLQPSPARPSLAEYTNHATRPQQAGPSGDTVTLTGSAQLLNNLEAKVHDVPTVDMARVDAIKNEIATGAYAVDAQMVAEQFTKFEADLEGGDRPRIERDVSFQKDKNGFSVSVNATSANGKTRSIEATYSFDAASSTVSRDVTRTGANGRTHEYHGEVTRTDNGFTNEQTVTGPGGRTQSRTVEQSYDAESDTLSRVISRSNDQGQTVERTVTATRTEGGIEVETSRDVFLNRQS